MVSFDLVDSGLSYSQIWELQKYLVEEIHCHRMPETLLFCEHELAVTAGRRARQGNLLSGRFPVFSIERGGDFTLHQPGQLVVYPLTKVQDRWKGLRNLLRGLEDLTIDMLVRSGLEATRGETTGVWIEPKAAGPKKRKIASIGIAVRHWISFHGLALNVCNDLSAFQAIRPCDFEASIMTSMKEQGVDQTVTMTRDRFLKAWETRFNETVEPRLWKDLPNPWLVEQTDNLPSVEERQRAKQF